MWKLFWKTKLCYVCFLKNLFNTSLVKSSWFLLLKLEFIFSWILISNFSWTCWLNLEIILWAFCHHLCHYQNFLNQLDSSSWSLLLQKVLWGSWQEVDFASWCKHWTQRRKVLCGSMLVKGFYKVSENAQLEFTWGLDIGTCCGQTSINPVLHSLFP